MTATTNNLINGPVPWVFVQLPSLDPPYQVQSLPFHAYIVTETDLVKRPAFVIPEAHTGFGVGAQYRMICYGETAIGFSLSVLAGQHQHLWYNGAMLSSVEVHESWGISTSITVTCISDGPDVDYGQFMIELGQGFLTTNA